MCICLMPLRIEGNNPSQNLRHFKIQMVCIARHKPDLVCLPECTFTGYLCERDDLNRFAEPIPGFMTAEMASIARQYRAYLCFGMLESTSDGVYDSAVLLDRQGQILIVQRKNAEKPPFINGDKLESAETDFAKVGILICGDLFIENVIRRLPGDLRLLIVPMALSFDGRSPDPERWAREERAIYLEVIKRVKTPAVIVNSLEVGEIESSFGGAMVVDTRSSLLAESPHGTDEILVYKFPPGDTATIRSRCTIIFN